MCEQKTSRRDGVVGDVVLFGFNTMWSSEYKVIISNCRAGLLSALSKSKLAVLRQIRKLMPPEHG